MMRLRPAFALGSAFLPRTHAIVPHRIHAPSRRHFTVKATLRPRIAVIGGGFGGLSTALRLASLPWTRLTRPQITLFDKSDRFVFLPMLYELATNTVESWEVAPPFSDLLQDTSIKYVRAQVDTINIDEGRVEGVTIGDEPIALQEPFDRAVIALGAECSNMELVPGAKEHALPFYTLANATAVREKIRSLLVQKDSFDVINVVVVGAGFSGVELAATLGEYLGAQGSVSLVERGDTLLKAGASHNRTSAKRALDDRGVLIELRTGVSSVDENSIVLQQLSDDGTPASDVVDERPVDIVLWTAGSRPSGVLSQLGLPLDERGRLQTDEFLQVMGMEDRIYALGDASHGADQAYYGTAQVAAQQSEYAAWNCWASLTDRAKLKYRYAHLGEMMVFGAKDGSVASTVGLDVDGIPAFALRRAAYLAKMPTDRHRMRVAASWAADPLLRGIANAASQVRRQNGID